MSGAYRSLVGHVARTVLPASLYRALRSQRGAVPPPGQVRFGDLRRVAPLSHQFGYDRGQPIDRYYIENFLGQREVSIAGRVLEVGDNVYTRQFGRERVTQGDVLHIDAGHPGATIIADLTRAENIADGLFDCVICTQTLHLIYDTPAAVRTLRRIIKPTGTVLVTIPGITPIAADRWGAAWYWAFTSQSAERMFTEHFSHVGVEQYGNVLSATGFLQGLASHELRPDELNVVDPRFPVILAVQASP